MKSFELVKCLRPSSLVSRRGATEHLLNVSSGRFQLNLSGFTSPHRMLSMHDINKSLYLCTHDERKIEIDKSSLRFKQVKENTKPIVLMLSWFYGQKHQINKYSKLYTDQGMDVLVGRVSLIQFVFNIKSVEKSAQNIVDLLHTNEDHYKEIFIHGFSVGGGKWGVIQRMMMKDKEKYGKIPERVIGQVWDSVAHPSSIIIAVPFALFPKSSIMQSLVKCFLWVHFKVYGRLQGHYADAVERLSTNMATAPALFFASKADKIGTEKFIRSLVETWQNRKIDVTLKCFDESQHVKHFQKYPEEYLKDLYEHWDRVKLLQRK